MNMKDKFKREFEFIGAGSDYDGGPAYDGDAYSGYMLEE